MRFKTNESQRGQADTATFRLAQFLGVFSVILGIIELIWGGVIARHTGLADYEWVVRIYGLREIMNGALILASDDPTPWIWLRVAGDALDAGTLIWGYWRDPSHWLGVVISFIAVTPVVIADIYAAMKLSSESKERLEPMHDYSDRSGSPRSA